MERCVPQAERDAHCVRDASYGRDVRFAREKEHITSLRVKQATSLCEAYHHLPARGNITLLSLDFMINLFQKVGAENVRIKTQSIIYGFLRRNH